MLNPLADYILYCGNENLAKILGLIEWHRKSIAENQCSVIFFDYFYCVQKVLPSTLGTNKIGVISGWHTCKTGFS